MYACPKSVSYGRDSVRELTLLLILSLLFVGPAIAQSPTATINGIVLDPSGAAIAGAQVVVVNDATEVQYATKTNGEGIYVVPNLPPGSYRIQVSNNGFKTIIKPDIVIHVQDALAINFTLPIGAASEIVTVEGGATLVNTEGAAVSTVIDRRFVEKLPLNGRSFNTLLQLTPGVVIAPTTGAAATGQFSIAGQRTDANNFTVDGVSANFGAPSGIGGGQSGTGTAQAFSVLGATSSLVSVDALQEFRVETSSFAPELGRSPGGQVILTTRAGTNDFHGGIFDYFRNTVMDANDWFANQTGQPRAAEHHNDFGGVLGGRILKDKTFFFLSYEGARLRLPQSAQSQVPSEWARTVAAPSTVAPFLNAYPQPDDRTVTSGVYTSPFTAVWSNSATLNAGSIRIDHTFNGRFSIFGRYNDAPSQLATPGGVSFLEVAEVNTRTLTAGMNMLLSSRLTNTLRGNYSTQDSILTDTFDSFGGAIPPNPSLLLGSLSSAGNIAEFQTGDTFQLSNGPQGNNRTKQLNFADDLAVSVRSHQLKFGGDYRDIFYDRAPATYVSFLTAETVQSLVSTRMGSLQVIVQQPTQLLTQALSLYAQDTWRITPRLTLTYGLRWELNPAPSARGATTLAAWENVNNPANFALAPSGTHLWRTTYGSFAPRVGVAYGLNQNRDFVLRAGWGIFYDLGVGQAASVATVFPNYFSRGSSGVSAPITDLTPYLPSTLRQAPYPGVYGFSQDLKLPRSYQWKLTLEKSFGGRQVVSATYVGQSGRDLLRAAGYWQPNPNFSSYFFLTTNAARSNYNALQLQYRRPISTHLQALLNYTWSHSLDSASNDVPGGSNTVISAANDYASSSFDVRHSFSGAVVYDIPAVLKSSPLSRVTKDWSLGGVVVARSGFPFNGIIFAASPLLGFTYTRPDLMPGQPFWIRNAAAGGGRSLNPAAFSSPPLDTSGNPVRQGTEGRNDISGFGLIQVDSSIGRKFPITERLNLQFRADAFNVLNHPNFANPSLPFVFFGPFFLKSRQMLNQGLGGLNPLFQEGGPRSLQLSLRLA